MDELKKRVSYLEGLAEGLQMTDGGTESKVLRGVIDVLQAVVADLEEVHEEQERFGEYLEVVDEDLSHLEDDYYLEAGDDEFIELACPKCGEKVLFEKALTDEREMEVEITCPNCGEVVYSNDEGQLIIESDEDELGDDESKERNEQ